MIIDIDVETDVLEKRLVDLLHRDDIRMLGYCVGCGLPHGQQCQCSNLREVDMGSRANFEMSVPND